MELSIAEIFTSSAPPPSAVWRPGRCSAAAAPRRRRRLPEVHLCRGLNDCKGQGKGGDNACRGQGACATAKEHSCHAQNDCKGLGGCGEDVGKNDCKGKGACAVPLMDSAWETLRKRKETEWGEKMLEFSAAPAKPS
jgi:hypothetical protein